MAGHAPEIREKVEALHHGAVARNSPRRVATAASGLDKRTPPKLVRACTRMSRADFETPAASAVARNTPDAMRRMLRMKRARRQ